MPAANASTEDAPGLRQLVYVSAAAPGFTLSDLEDVLRVSRERNARNGVTGMLLFETSSFLQVLEGDGTRIEALYNRIQADPRHTNKVLLLREPIKQRSFADWSMGYTQTSLGEIQDASGVNDFFKDAAAIAELNAQKVRKVLDLFRSGSFRQKVS
jgi:hypothetical protein